MSGSRKLLLAFGIPVALLLLVQLVPYGRNHTHPAAGNPTMWDSPATRDLAQRACFDCHSNETRWPWYASIAPMSWRIQSHVTEGRGALNFSAFEPGNEQTAEAAGEAGEAVSKGEMPPRDYLLLHPEARLTPEEKRALVTGLETTFAAFGEKEGKRGGGAANPGTESDEDEEHEKREGRGESRE